MPLFVLLLSAALVSAGVTPEDYLARGQKLLAELEYEGAAYELMMAATAADAPDEVKLRANLLAGIAHRVIGKDSDAHINFRYVLLRAPETRLPPDTAPKVLLYFESVRQEIDAERDVARHDDSAHSAAVPAPVASAAVGAPATTTTAPSATVLSGIAAVAVGGLALVAGGAGVVFAETSLADPDRDGGEREALQSVGQWSTGAAAVGAGVAVVGGVVLMLGAGEP